MAALRHRPHVFNTLRLRAATPIIKYELGPSSIMATPDCPSRPTEMLGSISELINLKQEIIQAYDKEVD